MFLVAMETLKSAERHGAGRAYLARLAPGARGSIDRLFAKAKKLNGNRRLLESQSVPGDVFEARRWLWDGDRQRYYGGTIWFGVQRTGALCMLTREDAFRAVHAAATIEGPAATDAPDHRRPARVVPADLRCVELPALAELPPPSRPCLP